MKTYQDQITEAGIKFEESYNLDERPHVVIDWQYTDGREGGDSYETLAFESEQDARAAFAAIDIPALAPIFDNKSISHVKSLWIDGEEVLRG
jgi:hypothetical protein